MRIHDRNSDGFREVLAGALLILLAMLLSGCGGSPTAPARCRVVTTPAVTQTTVICLGGVCVSHVEVITPTRETQVCQ